MADLHQHLKDYIKMIDDRIAADRAWQATFPELREEFNRLHDEQKLNAITQDEVRAWAKQQFEPTIKKLEAAPKQYSVLGTKVSHYAEGRTHEPWDIIRDWNLNYFAGNALKYISRYERKGTPVEDLKKAIHYLEKELERYASHI